MQVNYDLQYLACKATNARSISFPSKRTQSKIKLKDFKAKINKILSIKPTTNKIK